MMSVSTTPFNLDDSCLSEFAVPLEGNSSHELVLEGRCHDDTIDALVADIRSAHNMICITSLFVHKSFWRCASQAQQIGLFDCLPDLEELSLSNVTMSADALLILLSRARHLKKIRMDRIVVQCSDDDEPNMTERLCNALSILSSLEEFHMSLGFGASLDGTVEQGTNLFVDGGEGSDNLEPLVQALSFIKSLRCVYLGTDRRAVMDPKTLASLSTSVEDITLRNVGLSPLHCSCFYSQSLQSLNLIQADLGDEGALILAQKIKKLSSLKKLYLPGNGITDKGGVAIVHALEAKATTLEVLDMHGNKLAATTGLVLSKWLKTSNSKLTFLDLSGNQGLGDEGGVALASALLENASLEQLVLFRCGLGNRTCRAMAMSLVVHKSLTKLNLYENERIGEDGIMALIECLEHHNCVLDWLEINTRTNKDLVKKLRFFLHLNRNYRRGKVLQSTSDKEFVEEGVLQATNQADASALFYFLSARPALFSKPAPTRPTPTPPTSITKVVSSSCFGGLVSQFHPLQAKSFCNPQA